MKKNAKKILVSLELLSVFAMGVVSSNALTMPVCAEELSIVENAITDVQLSLTENVLVKFYANVPAEATEVKMTFDFNGKNTVITGEQNGNQMMFCFEGVTPQHFNDEITATLSYLENDVEKTCTKKMSVQKYCTTILKSNAATFGITEHAFQDLKTLVVDILNYGAEAQKYTNEDLDNLVTNVLTEDEKSLATSFESVKVNLRNDLSFSDKSNKDVMWKEASLRFNYNLNLKLTFDTLVDVSSLEAKVFKNGMEETAVISKEKEIYSLVYDNVSAKEFDTPITIQLYKDGVEFGSSITYSVRSYINAYVDSENDFAELAKKTYIYGKSAENYSYALVHIDFSNKIQLGNAKENAPVLSKDGSYAIAGKVEGVYYNDHSNSKQVNTFYTKDGTNVRYYNGADGFYYGNLSDINNRTGGYICFDVNIPQSGYYKLHMRAQYPSNVSNAYNISGIFKANVNGRKAIKVGEVNENLDLSTLEYDNLTDRFINSYDNATNNWNNQINWSIGEVGTYYLEAGDNYFTMFAKGGNVDYLMLESEDVKLAENVLVDFRDQKEKIYSDNVLMLGRDERITYIDGYGDGFGDGFTGLYLRVKSSKVGLQDVPLTMKMLEEAGLTEELYEKGGDIKLTFNDLGLDKQTMSITLRIPESNTFVSEHYQAEDHAFFKEDYTYVANATTGATRSVKKDAPLTSKENSTQTFVDETTTSIGKMGNGSENTQIASLSSNPNYNLTENKGNTYFRFTETVPMSGRYNVLARVTAQTTSNLNNKFDFTVTSGTEVVDSGRFTNTTTAMKSATQIFTSDNKLIGNNWSNIHSYSFVNLGSLNLQAGENTITLDLIDKCSSNIDYFMIVGSEAKIAETEVINLRGTNFANNASKETVLGNVAETALHINNGTNLSALYRELLDQHIAKGNSIKEEYYESLSFTGLYFRIYQGTFEGKEAYILDVPVTENMISGIEKDEAGNYLAGTYNATITYTDNGTVYTAELMVVVD